MTIRTTFKSGKKKVEVVEVEATSREECKLLAKEKENVLDDDVASVKVSFGFR